MQKGVGFTLGFFQRYKIGINLFLYTYLMKRREEEGRGRFFFGLVWFGVMIRGKWNWIDGCIPPRYTILLYCTALYCMYGYCSVESI